MTQRCTLVLFRSIMKKQCCRSHCTCLLFHFFGYFFLQGIFVFFGLEDGYHCIISLASDFFNDLYVLICPHFVFCKCLIVLIYIVFFSYLDQKDQWLSVRLAFTWFPLFLSRNTINVNLAPIFRTRRHKCNYMTLHQAIAFPE